MIPSSVEASHRTAFRWIDRSLSAFGLCCLIFYAIFTARAAIYQRRANADINAMVAARRPSEAAVSRRVPETAPPSVPVMRGDVIGRVEVPRLKLSAAVAEGDDDSTLGKAVGHLPDTPLPWQQKGNVAFAAHRDGLFRPLRNIRLNDEVRVITARGDFSYRVRKTQIVDPDAVWVIAPTPRPTLTLITCYPFSFVGHAPHRFIVQAERVDDGPAGDPAGVAIRGTVAQ
ncbi:MAG TPA: class D sortase [Vicinamibacterales bacterium]|jgi:LPXTG-site transpeptidase (sortase) family protein|nr:class D sortase [Vicinamibacterales bacterium]